MKRYPLYSYFLTRDGFSFRKKAAFVLFLSAAGLFFRPHAGAAVQYWSGTGTWSSTGENWSGTAGGPYETVYDNADSNVKVFEGNAGTVTLSGEVFDRAMLFTTDGYLVDGSGGTIVRGSYNNVIGTTSGVTVTLRDMAYNTPDGLRLGGLGAKGTDPAVHNEGVVVLTGTTRFTGTGARSNEILLSEGTLRLGSATATGNGYLKFDGAATSSPRKLEFAGGIGAFTISSIEGSATDFALTDIEGEAVTLTLNSETRNSDISGNVSGKGSLVKEGAAVLTLSGTNSYEGSTTVNGGTLVFSNAASWNKNALTVNAGTVSFNMAGWTESDIAELKNDNVTAQRTATFKFNANNTAVDAGCFFGVAGGMPQIELENGTFNADGNITYNNSLLLNRSSAYGTTLNVNAGNTLTLSNGSLVLGNNIESGYASTVINVWGTVVNGNETQLLRSSNINVNDQGVWRQNAAFTIAGKGGYSAQLTINEGGVFSCNGVDPFCIDASGIKGTGNSSLVVNGGTFETTQGIEIKKRIDTETGGGGGAFVTLENGGTVKLLADIDEFFTGDGVNDSATKVRINNGDGIFDTNGFNTSVSQNIETTAGTGNLVKTGAGTLTLTGTNTYNGATTVAGGTLAITGTGSINGSSGVTVNAGGTLSVSSSVALRTALTVETGGTLQLGDGTAGSTGTVTMVASMDGTVTGSGILSGGSFEISGAIAPGTSAGVGTLTFGTGGETVSFTDTAKIIINVTNETTFDTVIAGGELVLDNVTVELVFAPGYVPAVDTELTLFGGNVFFDSTEAQDAAAANITSNYGGSFEWLEDGSGNITGIKIMAIPEPSTYALLGAGVLAGLALVRRRKRA